MCAIDFDGACDVWTEEYRTARTPKKCATCRMPIQPGDPYMHHRSLYEGDWNTEAVCAPCVMVLNDFADAHGVSLTPSTLIDFLNDCVFGSYRTEKHELDPSWRNHLAFLKRRIRRARRLNRCSRTSSPLELSSPTA